MRWRLDTHMVLGQPDIIYIYIYATMPLSGLCALWRCGLACCGRHGEQRCAPGAGEKSVAFCRALVLFSQKKNSRNCVLVAGGLSPCEMCVLSSALICNALA